MLKYFNNCRDSFPLGGRSVFIIPRIRGTKVKIKVNLFLMYLIQKIRYTPMGNIPYSCNSKNKGDRVFEKIILYIKNQECFGGQFHHFDFDILI